MYIYLVPAILLGGFWVFYLDYWIYLLYVIIVASFTDKETDLGPDAVTQALKGAFL